MEEVDDFELFDGWGDMVYTSWVSVIESPNPDDEAVRTRVLWW